MGCALKIKIDHRFVAANGLRFHIAEAGEGPVVLLLHGFPECWYSWRHQLSALAAAGFRAIALDQRGFGRSDRPSQMQDYTLLHLVGDVVGVLDALGAQRAALVGHDWGAYVAWHVATMRPDRISGIAALSLPHQPRGTEPPMTTFRTAFGDDFYMLHFLKAGPADAELSRDPRKTFRLILRGGARKEPRHSRSPVPMISPDGTFLGGYSEPRSLPDWLLPHDLDTYAAEFASGFTGGLNWYRNMDRNWELTAAWHNAPVYLPALYIVGEHDQVLHWPNMTEHIETIRERVPAMRGVIRIPQTGHWTQEEAPEVVNAALIDFLTTGCPPMREAC